MPSAERPKQIWICPFCHTRNHFPAHYSGISESALPAELFPSYTTLEYALPRPHAPPPAYLFCVDTVVEEAELQAAKTAIQQALSLLPENACVGLVTFGQHVHVHELGFADCPRSHVFRGSKEHSSDAVADQLGLARRGVQGRGAAPVAAASAQRFLSPLSECEFALTSALEALSPDAFPALPDQRPSRCTGSALAVAQQLLACCCAGAPARLLLLVGGPATEGPGAVVAKELAVAVRSHKDLVKDAAPLHKKALRHYEQLAQALQGAGHGLDVFACALDQVGLAELRPAVERSAGVCVLAESFAHDVFRASFTRLFQGPGAAGLATLEMLTSRDVRCEGALGACASAEKHSLAVADTQVGCGGTCAWRMNALGPDTTLAFYFEVAATGGGGQGGAGAGGAAAASAQASQQQQFFLQFVTTYALPSGEWRMRISTITRRWTDGASASELGAGFDQEAAAVLVARLVSWKMETEEDFDATRWLDRTLIRLCARFGDFRKDEPGSFALSPAFAIYPQFVFNLRRSQFVQVFNNSPDETAYFRMVLNRAPVTSALLMIQPSIVAYSFNAPPEPVLLDVASITPDRVLLLDAYFSVVVFHGAQCAAWRKAGYAEQEEHAAFAALLAAPKADCAAIVADRFPRPRVVDCDQGGSQARFLLARLNPSATHATASYSGGEVVLTDDVSFAVFLEHLRKLAVTS
jgi:protein transport protein SEC23